MRQTNYRTINYEIDLVAILFDPRGKVLQLNLLENAVGL